jgi:hypothetical protein
VGGASHAIFLGIRGEAHKRRNMVVWVCSESGMHRMQSEIGWLPPKGNEVPLGGNFRDRNFANFAKYKKVIKWWAVLCSSAVYFIRSEI